MVLYVPPSLRRAREEEEDVVPQPLEQEVPQEAPLEAMPLREPEEAVQDPSTPEPPLPTETLDEPPAPLPEPPEPVQGTYVPPSLQKARQQEDYVSPEDEEVDDVPKLTKSDVLADPERVGTLRQYMIARKGQLWENRSDEEVLDAYLSHMRWVGTNEVSLFREVSHMRGGDDAYKQIAADAFTLYDEIAPFWDSGSFGEGARAFGEYAAAAIIAPSTLLSAGIGKLVTQSAIKGSARALLQQAYSSGGREAAEIVGRSYARKKGVQAAATATVTDGSANTAFDYVYQRELMMGSGVQKDFNWLQSGLAAATGLISGGISLAPQLTRGVAGPTSASVKESVQKAQEKALGKALPRIKTQLDNLLGELDSQAWKDAVARGEQFNLRQNEVDKFVNSFFSVKNPESLVSILSESGAVLKTTDENFTQSFIQYMRNFPQKELTELNEKFEPVLGVSFGEAMDILADSMSRSGSRFGEASQASKAMKSYYDLAGAKARANSFVSELADDIKAPSEADKLAKSPQIVKYAQSLWRRALVAHLSTTQLNVQGWSIAYGARALAESFNASTYLVEGGLKAMAGGGLSNPAMAKSSALYKNQIFKMKTLMDPYSSRESFEAFLDNAPKNFKEVLMREHFGGIRSKDNLEIYNIPSNKLTRGMETVSTVASRASLVQFQDVWTKTLSGIGELDKQSRLKFNKGINQLVKDGEVHKISKEMWEDVIGTALEDTFSKDYTRSPYAIKYLARIADSASNMPFLGFTIPFGKFMTNALAFSTAYSPAAMLPIAEMITRQAPGTDIREAISKAVVGTVGLIAFGKMSYDAMQEGKQWNELETSTGEIVDAQNIAPLSGHLLFGRMIQLMARGENVPHEMWIELAGQASLGQYADVAGAPSAVLEVLKAVSAPREPGEDVDIIGPIMREGMDLLFGVLSGYTRPLEPLNILADGITQSKVQVDRRIPRTTYDKAVTEFTRYTDALLYPLIGGADEDGPIVPARSMTRPEGDIKDPNPLARLFGFKRAQNPNHINILLGKINYPPFRLEQRSGIPEWDRLITERIAPDLNREAKRLLNNEWFQKLPGDRQISEVRKMVAQLRNEWEEVLAEGLYAKNEIAVLKERRKFTGLDSALRNQAKRALNLSDVEDRDLSLAQIESLRSWMELEKENSDLFIKERGR